MGKGNDLVILVLRKWQGGSQVGGRGESKSESER